MADLKNFSLFGFRIRKKSDETKEIKTFVPPAADDGAVTISSSAFFGSTAIDVEGVAKNEIELITRYREMSQQPEIETAIEDIVNEAIVQDKQGKNVKLVLDDLKQPDKIKKAIADEFNTIERLLNYNNLATDIFRRYYVDGRLYYQIIIDVNAPQKGILELRYIDPRKIKKVRQIKKRKDDSGIEVIENVEEFYLFNDRVQMASGNQQPGGVKIAIDSVLNVNSGLLDPRRSMVLSYLHKAIKPLNQLRMIEDASVIYKISRAPQRRVFYIDVGNLPKVKAEQYVRDIMTKYKNKITYDATTGEIRDDRRHLSMLEDFWFPRRCLSLQTKIKLLDGRDEKLENLILEYQEGKTNWVYSVSPEGEIVPGKISWAGITKKNAEVIKITLDNGCEEIVTPDHKFVLRDGSLCEAQNLTTEMSLMPLYTREKLLSAKYSGSYSQFYNNKTNRWNFTHRMVSNFINEEKKLNEVIHHVDFNRYNNNPENLLLIDKLDHYELHSKFGANSWNNGNREEHCKNLSISGKVFFRTRKGEIRKQEISEFNKKDERIKNGLVKGRENIKLLREKDKTELSKEEYLAKWSKGLDLLIQHTTSRKIKEDAFEFSTIENIIHKNFHKKINTQEILEKIQEVYPNFKYKTIKKYFPLYGYKNLHHYLSTNYKEYNKPCYYNHKIIKIEKLDYKIDTGTLTIDENHEHHNFHNFALSSGIFVKNSDGKATEVTTLQSTDNFNDMSMVEYFQKALYKSLNVPITRLDPSQAVSIGRSMEITRDELKFSKFVEKLRKKFTDLFYQALRVQLVLKGVCTEEEWQQFKEDIYFDFTVDNNFVELKESELYTERLNLLAIVDPFVNKYFSEEWVQKNILRLDDEDIEQMHKQMEKGRDKDFKRQVEETDNQVKLQARSIQLQTQLGLLPEQPIEAGQEAQGSPGQSAPATGKNNPYNV